MSSASLPLHQIEFLDTDCLLVKKYLEITYMETD
jgi:hypothetical protein